MQVGVAQEDRKPDGAERPIGAMDREIVDAAFMQRAQEVETAHGTDRVIEHLHRHAGTLERQPKSGGDDLAV